MTSHAVSDQLDPNARPEAPHEPPAIAWMLHRWPTVLAVAVGALVIADLTIDESFVDSTAALCVLIVLVYVGAAALRRPGAAWPILLLGLPVALVPFGPGAVASLVLVVATAVFVAYGALRGRRDVRLQTIAALAVAGMSIVALAVEPTVGAYLLAAALLAHAGWDVYHHMRDRVVARSYTEFCALFDVILGAAILVAAG
jgi:hypothetical protein